MQEPDPILMEALKAKPDFLTFFSLLGSKDSKTMVIFMKGVAGTKSAYIVRDQNIAEVLKTMKQTIQQFENQFGKKPTPTLVAVQSPT